MGPMEVMASMERRQEVRKHMISPPKIKISEANNHHTASLPVGIPVAVLWVAMGPCIDIIILF